MKIAKHTFYSLAGAGILIFFSWNILLTLNFPYLSFKKFTVNSNTLIFSALFFIIFYLSTIIYIRIYNFIAHENYSIDFFTLSYFFTLLRVGFSYLLFAYIINYYTYFHYIYSPLKMEIILNIIIFIGILILFAYERNAFAKEGKEKKSPFLIAILIIIFLLSYTNFRLFEKKLIDININPSIKSKTGNTFVLNKKRRVINLYIEGLSYDFIFPLISNGKLPNFGWLIENGVWSRTKTLEPINKCSAYYSYITGVYPSQNLMYSFWKKSFSSSFEFSPYLLSNGFFLKSLEKLGFIKKLYSKPFPKYRKNIFQFFEKFNIKSVKIRFLKEEKEFSFPKKSTSQLPSPFDELELNDTPLIQSLKKDIIFDEQRFSLFLQHLNNPQKSRFFFLYIDGLLDAELRFYKYTFPEYYSSVSEEEIHKYGGILEKYYQYIDQYIGRILLNLKSNDILIVNSSFGVSPLDPLDQMINNFLKKENLSAKISSSPEGVLLIYGNGIRKNHILKNFSFLNIFPMIAYYFQLPVPYSSNEYFTLEMFKKDYIKENPIFFSYSEDKR